MKDKTDKGGTNNGKRLHSDQQDKSLKKVI